MPFFKGSSHVYLHLFILAGNIKWSLRRQDRIFTRKDSKFYHILSLILWTITKPTDDYFFSLLLFSILNDLTNCRALYSKIRIRLITRQCAKNKDREGRIPASSGKAPVKWQFKIPLVLWFRKTWLFHIQLHTKRFTVHGLHRGY